jgi:prolyl 4-hydroxylase
MRRNTRRSKGAESTHCLTGIAGKVRSTRWATITVMRRPPQVGQAPPPLQEKATSISSLDPFFGVAYPPSMGLYLGHFDFEQQLVWSVPGLFTPDECAALIAGAAAGAWLPATVNSASGRVVAADIRDSSTAVLRDPALAADLHARITPHVPARMTAELGSLGRVPVQLTGVHVPVRIYRYEPGQHFGLHQDQSYSSDDGARSLLTLMVYLNDDFEGGETSFPEQGQLIVPRAGSALLFQHMLLHAGNRVVRGTKFVLRSDVLYRPVAS